MGSHPNIWRDRAFVRLWGATGVSMVGSQVTLLALPLAAVLALHATAGQVAALAAAGTAPFLLLGLPAGVWLDRWRLRSVMVATDVARAVLLASVPTAYLFDALTLGHLYVVAFTTGACAVFFDVAALSVLPGLVTSQALARANSGIEAARAGAQTSGPALGGVLVHLLTAPVAILVDAGSYLVSAVLLRGLPQTGAETGAAATVRRSLLREITAGLRFCLRHPYIGPLAAGAAWINFWVEALMAVFLVHAVRDLALSAAVIGMVLAVANVGYLAGSLAVPRVSAWIGVGHTIVLGAFLNVGLVLVATAPVSAPLPLLVVGFCVFTFGSALWNVNAVSLRQASTEPAMLARMNATNRFLIWGTMPLGAAAGGLLTTWIGLAHTVLLAAVAVPLCALPLLRSPIGSVDELAPAIGAEIVDTSPQSA